MVTNESQERPATLNGLRPGIPFRRPAEPGRRWAVTKCVAASADALYKSQSTQMTALVRSPMGWLMMGLGPRRANTPPNFPLNVYRPGMLL